MVIFKELKEMVIHQCQVPVHSWSERRPPSKIRSKGRMVDVDNKETYRNKNVVSRFIIWMGEKKN